MTYAPISIDLSRVPVPAIIEPLNAQSLIAQFIARFTAIWEDARADNPTLPAYDVEQLETDPVIIVGQAFAFLRLLDRQRVNDGIKALLATEAKGTNLDAVVARQNVERLTITPANGSTPAVMENDASLLRRYLLSFDRAAAGSRDCYLYQAFTAWPQMHDARVNGHAIHGRRGDTDVVIIGPMGAIPSPAERALVTAAVLADHVKPEAVSVAVIDATPLEYSVEMVIEVPPGPDAEIIRSEVIERVRSAGAARMLIGGEIPAGLLSGAAYGPNVIKVRDLAPVEIAADPYTVPVLTSIAITLEIRA
ncbi:phage-related baseplate assembly protein [Hoeflea marina]|uniref:Phage-related baseplate assembly protein n=1 Tax=Hoeflea marina TaxID=274592 RepID=A0A317PF16_9HYPH|nr:baseplate J/gp47 family protein [Hoeflea marina]PWV97706.1 phage-related baseplate assembly protein [Hoeflea marina]